MAEQAGLGSGGRLIQSRGHGQPTAAQVHEMRHHGLPAGAPPFAARSCLASLTMLASSRADCMLMLGGCDMMAAGGHGGRGRQNRSAPGRDGHQLHNVLPGDPHSAAPSCPTHTVALPHGPESPLTLGQVGLLAQPRPQQHLLLEVQVLLVEDLGGVEGQDGTGGVRAGEVRDGEWAGKASR